MGHRLGAVNQYQRADGLRQPDDLGYRVDGTQGIGDVVYRYHLHAAIQQACQRLQVELAGIGHRNRNHLGAGG